MQQWPYSSQPNGPWKCQVCGRLVLAYHEVLRNEEGRVVGHRFYPESRYWNAERQEVYCGAVHSLQRHEAGYSATKEVSAAVLEPAEAVRS